MFSLCPLTVLPCSPFDQIDAALEAGYDSVGLRVLPALPTDVDFMADPSLQDAVSQKLSETGLQVLDIEAVRISPDLDVPAFEPVIQYANTVGARLITATGLPAEWTDEYEAACLPKIAELCEMAECYGVRVSLEFMIYRSIATLPAALSLREKIGHPALAICLDALHFYRSGGRPEELSSVDENAIACFQICDAPLKALQDLPKEARYGRLLPGAGGLPLIDMLRALPPNIPIAVEAPDAENGHLSAYEKARRAACATRDVMAAAGLHTGTSL